MSDGTIIDVDLPPGAKIHVGYATGVRCRFYDVHTEEKSFSVCTLCAGIVEWDEPRESHICPPAELIALRDRRDRGF